MASGSVESCDVPIPSKSASVEKNAANIIASFMRKAKDSGADIVHFSECALSGYAGAES